MDEINEKKELEEVLNHLLNYLKVASLEETNKTEELIFRLFKWNRNRLNLLKKEIK